MLCRGVDLQQKIPELHHRITLLLQKRSNSYPRSNDAVLPDYFLPTHHQQLLPVGYLNLVSGILRALAVQTTQEVASYLGWVGCG